MNDEFVISKVLDRIDNLDTKIDKKFNFFMWYDDRMQNPMRERGDPKFVEPLMLIVCCFNN